MPTRDADDRLRCPEEYLRTIAESARTIAESTKTIAGVLVDFFEGDRTMGGPCLASIDDSMKRNADALELLTGIAGFSNRLQSMADRMEFQNTQIQSLHDMVVTLLGDRRGDPPSSTEDAS